ncbi:MAG: hypothetical protein SGILL_003277, partial [Bacillariaceae sp.]
MSTDSPTNRATSDRWAQSLVGRDWEIYWVDEEDNADADADINNYNGTAMDIATSVEASSGDCGDGSSRPDAPSEQQQPPEQQQAQISPEMMWRNINSAASITGQESVEEERLETSTADNMHVGDGESAKPEPIKMEDEEDSDNDEEGSVIDDWYDGHVLGVETVSPQGPDESASYNFRIRFVGEDTIYNVSLTPSKVRPSARGWVQRTVALLRPLAGDEDENDVEMWETKLPLDTSRLQEESALQQLEKRIVGSGASGNSITLEANDKTCLSSVPTSLDFDRIQRLQYLLEAQILLRSKLAKIESPDGEDRFTDGVRNPTEPYVNHLVQCCRDLIQACSWHSKAWKLLRLVFGDASSGNEEQLLTFERLMDEYIRYGKDAIVSLATMGIDSCSSGKRRLPVSPSATSGRRGSKRRRLKASSSSDMDQTNGCESVVTAASELEKDMFSTHLVDSFVAALEQNGPRWYEKYMGTMLQSLSHLIVQPLVRWKGQVGLILRNADAITLVTGRSTVLGHPDECVETVNDCEMKDANAVELCPRGESTADSPVSLKNATNVEKDSGSYSDGSEEEPKFTYTEVQQYSAEIRNNRTLSTFDLVGESEQLQQLLRRIEQNEKMARSLFCRLTENMSPQNEKDEILEGLREIIKAIEDPTSPLSHIEPLSTNNNAGSLTINKDDVLDAFALREWFVNIERVKSLRERRSLVLALHAVVEEDVLPDLEHAPRLAAHGNIVTCREEGVQSITQIYNEDLAHRNLSEKYEKELHLSAPLQCIDGFDSVACIGELQSALTALAETPTISLTDEKICSRIDMISWSEDAKKFLAKLNSAHGKAVSLEETRMLDDARISLLAGRSPSRVKLTRDLKQDDKVDSEIRAFVSTDLHHFCGPLANDVEKLYQMSSSWKERADSILFCLRVHGNPHAGLKLAAQKLPAMVDIKRIDDLVSDYAESQVVIDGNNELVSIKSDSYRWSQAMLSTLGNENVSFSEALSLVENARDDRPKGLMMDPTRAVVDSIVDLLLWYQKVAVTFNDVLEKVAQLSSGGDALSESTSYSEVITEMVYPLLADGSDVLEVYCSEYCSSRGITRQFKAQSEHALGILDRVFDVRRSSKAVTSEKIQSNELIQNLLSRMITNDEKECFPLQLLLWFQWHLFVSNFVAPFDKSDKKRLSGGSVTSLRNAIELRDRQPFLCDSIDLSGTAVPQALIQVQSQELIEFDRIIHTAQETEEEIRAMFFKAKDLLRGSIQKPELILSHLSQLKQYLSIFKARLQGEGGVALNEALGGQLDSHIKIFGWLSRTFPYPILHQEESSFSSQEEEAIEGESNDMRIPWDALVSLKDKIPKDVEGSGDFALCVMRVTELYEACSKWNNEITTFTLLSNRGNKRRVATSLNAENDDSNVESNEGENAAKLQMAKMELLASDPILKRCEMPREKALKSMIQNSRQFEVEMKEFLGQDYHGTNQDKSPFPTGGSLIGENGQFILYRLTLSPLFDLMLSSMKKLSQVGDNVFAETPGKDAFDWMTSAVTWIERLHFAVSMEAPFNHSSQKLIVISCKQATELCILGEDIFLRTTESTRQTLSSHGINVSTSALKKRLTVTLKKDGAHHSVGGIVMRWCPILFDALRADSLKTDLWHRKIQKLIASFLRFDKVRTGRQQIDEDHIFRYFEYREKLRSALHEGQQSLIVMPKKEEISAFYNVLDVMDSFLDEHSTDVLNKKFAKHLHRNASSVHDHRFVLLDTLLYRKALAPEGDGVFSDASTFDGSENDKIFRDICRSNLEAAFTTAAKELRLDLSRGSDASSLCAIKAMEIENEMFNRYQQEAGQAKVSEEYRNKARSLKSNLTPKNLTLCIGVMTGEIGPSVLVRMTPDQLANRKTKLERENAKQAALRDTVLTRGFQELSKSDLQDSTPSSKRHSPPSPEKKPKSSILHSRTARADNEKTAPSTSDALEDAKKSPEREEEQHSDQESDVEEELPDDDGIPTLEADAPEESDAGVASPSSSSILKLSSYMSTLKAPPSKPPPPPPSLATGQSWPITGGGRGRRVNSSNGGEKFRIETHGKSTLAFSAAFYQEDEDAPRIDDHLPETLVQKGRLKSGEFKKFVGKKLKGGKWQSACLRLTTLTDMDSSVYKAFYKEFESKDRIAMFKVRGDSGSNLFLVTPKFHEEVVAPNIVEEVSPKPTDEEKTSTTVEKEEPTSTQTTVTESSKVPKKTEPAVEVLSAAAEPVAVVEKESDEKPEEPATVAKEEVDEKPQEAKEELY